MKAIAQRMTWILTAVGVSLGGVAQAQTVCSGTNENSAVTATTPTAEFIDHGDGTVTHIRTGLMWKRCSQGQTWDGSTCTGTVIAYNWSAALAQGANEVFPLPSGHDDWRLPNAKELASIVERRCFSPTVNVAIFPGMAASQTYWTSSSMANNANAARVVAFGGGTVSSQAKNSTIVRVRLVRAGP